jgi:hypothetical protein
VENIIQIIKANAPLPVLWVLAGLGALVCVGYAYVAITPKKDDDAFLQKLEEKPVIGHLLKILKAFSPVQRKEDK